MKRKIIHIEKELCNGCGQCIIDCAESALEIRDGKACLVGEVLCDGLGACLGNCPAGALHLIEREALPYDQKAVDKRIQEQQAARQSGPFPSCPGTAAMSLGPMPRGGQESTPTTSALSHWPVKLALLSPQAPFLNQADIALLADCAAAAASRLHQDILPGHAIAMACPKLDNADAHIHKLKDIIIQAKPNSLTVYIMEVPCCKGLLAIAKQAVALSGMEIPLHVHVISRTGHMEQQEA